MTPLTIIQARMGSERLPGKPLLEIGGKTVLEHVRDRLMECEADLGDIVVATTNLEEDWPIWREAQRLGLACYRSPTQPDDVLGRFMRCWQSYMGHSPIIRITADCPFLDPGLLADVVYLISEDSYREDSYDYVGVRGAPAGYHQEAFKPGILNAAHRWARAASDREHVVPWMLRNGRCGWVDGWSCPRGAVELNTYTDFQRLRARFA